MLTEKILIKAVDSKYPIYLDQKDVSNLSVDQILDLIDEIDPVSITINGKMYVL